eukprot:366220-Chlamydomonas_euryale.AAC.4
MKPRMTYGQPCFGAPAVAELRPVDFRAGPECGDAGVSVRVRVTGSGPMKGIPVLSAAGQRGLRSGLDAVRKGTSLRAVLSQPIPPPNLVEPGHENRAQSCIR